MKPQLLKAAVLDALAEIDEPATQRMILLTIRVLLGVRLTYTDLRTVLDELEHERRVVGITSEDGESKWTITDNGRGDLAELRT